MNTKAKLLHWAPRILSILAILFISLFALDTFEPGRTLWQQIGAFLIHLIPSFVLLLVLIIAWKRELIGGSIFLLLGIVLSPFVYTHNYNMNHSVWMSLGIIMAITIPFAIVGILFIMSHLYQKRHRPT